MKKLVLFLAGILLFTGVAFAGTSDGNWAGRRPDYNTRTQYTAQEQANLILRRLMPFVSSYYGIEVVASSDNFHILAITIPADYNLYYPTMTLQAVTNTYTQTITVGYECNFAGFDADGSTATIRTNFGNINLLPNGVPVNVSLPYYITPTFIFTGLTPQSTYYLLTSGRVPKP
jgi:hypothetical protein